VVLLKRSIAQAFVIPFRVLNKKYDKGYLKIICFLIIFVSELVPLRGDKYTLQSHPQNKILVPVRDSIYSLTLSKLIKYI